LLQRGRARAGAECKLHRVELELRSLRLQRGRARAGAECGFMGFILLAIALASTGPRPRGRGMRSRWSSFPNAATCFNGAAPARARNGNEERRSRMRKLSLQRGRARAGAEWWRH